MREVVQCDVWYSATSGEARTVVQCDMSGTVRRVAVHGSGYGGWRSARGGTVRRVVQCGEWCCATSGAVRWGGAVRGVQCEGIVQCEKVAQCDEWCSGRVGAVGGVVRCDKCAVRGVLECEAWCGARGGTVR